MIIKAKDLIAKLKECDPDAIVDIINNDDGKWYSIIEYNHLVKEHNADKEIFQILIKKNN